MPEPADRPQDLRRVRVVYTGLVQGVGFRATVKSVAASHDARGWVRNEPDGSVLAEVQGPPEVTEVVLTDIARRRRQFIAAVSAAEVPAIRNETSFEIQR